MHDYVYPTAYFSVLDLTARKYRFKIVLLVQFI
jgi:hypothetical protein